MRHPDRISARLARLWRKIIEKMEPIVFFGSAGLVILFVAFGGGRTDLAERVFEGLSTGIANDFGWFYAITTTGILAFVLFLAVSPLGRVRLGRPDEEPEFSTPTWFAMLFAAGMGTGLVFFGVAEPLTHWSNPPLGAEPRSDAALLESMRLTFMHWGLHPWAVYIVLAAGIALAHFRFRLPLAPRSLLWPLIGERIHGPIGHVTDILCTVGTLVGVAASLGLGAMQINHGLERLGLAAYETDVQLLIIAAITLVATISVVTGIHYGIRLLSQINVSLGLLLLLFVLVAGPTFHLLRLWTTSIGEYVAHLPELGFWTAPLSESARRWQEQWTFSYWGWWLAWSPFVGIFVGRISKGRTLREFVLAVLFGPVLASFLWMAVFGGTGLAIAQESHGFAGGGAAFADEIVETPAVALHAVFEHLPLAGLTGIAATLLTIVFFVTSSDSGSLVDDMVTSGGHPNPPRAQRVFWAVSEGLLAGVLLLTNGLDALRSAAISVGLPMSVLLVLASWGLYRAARRARREDLEGRESTRA